MQKEAADTETLRRGRWLAAWCKHSFWTQNYPISSGAAKHTGIRGEMLCHQFKSCSFHHKIPSSALTAHSLEVHHTTSYTTSGNTKKKSKSKPCTKAVRQNVSCITKQAQGYVLEDNWDLQAAQVYRMNFVPKGRFSHWYFRRMRKPLKITCTAPFLQRDAIQHTQPCPAPPSWHTGPET